MKFNVSSKTLYNYASAVRKVINSKNAMTVLNNFKLTLDDDRLSITGSDVENALTATLPVTEAEGSGSFCVDAARFTDLLKEIPEMDITVEIDNSFGVHVKYSSGTFDFVAVAGAEYPEYKREDGDQAPQEFFTKGCVLNAGIENTLFATSTDDYRPMMMGIFLDIKPEGINFVATDTRRLVKYEDRRSAPGITASCILPSKPASILRNIFNGDEDVMVTMSSKSATFENSSFAFNCRFIQGNFPDYNRVIPKNNTLELIVDRSSFLNAVRRVGLFVDAAYGLEKFSITADSIEIKTQDTNLMTAANEKVPCAFSGDNLVIGFSAPFLIDVLNTLKTSDIIVNLSDPGRPGIFRPSENQPDTDLLMLLMPMTVGEF